MKGSKQKWMYGSIGLLMGVLITVLVGTGMKQQGSSFQGYLNFQHPAALSPVSKQVLPVSSGQKVPGNQNQPGNQPGNVDGPITRAELMKLLVVVTGVTINTAGGPHFTDVNQQEWEYGYVETAYNAGWIQPYPDGSFKPFDTVLRAEGAKFFHRAILEPAISVLSPTDPACEYPDVAPEAWFHNVVNHDCHQGILDVVPGTNFFPSNLLMQSTAQKWITNAQNII